MAGLESSAVFPPARKREVWKARSDKWPGSLAGDRKQDRGVFVAGVFKELANQLQHRPRRVAFGFRGLLAIRLGIERHIAFGEFGSLQIVQTGRDMRDNVGANQDGFEVISLM